MPGFRRKSLSQDISGRMLLRPTRVHEKFGGFHISTHVPTQNAPDFTLPNKDIPKTCPILDPSLCRRIFRGVCFCAPTRVRAKFDGFHTSAHDMTRIPPGFRPKPLARNILGRIQYAPTRVYEKFGGFHISAHDMARNPTGFGLCHTTWRETRRVLDFATRHGAKPGGFWTLSHDIA